LAHFFGGFVHQFNFLFCKIKSIEMLPGLTLDELIKFVSSVSLPIKEILRRGGIQNILKEGASHHIVIEELDYSEFLGNEGEESKDIWVYLFKESGSYLGKYADTNGQGEVVFSLPEQSYNGPQTTDRIVGLEAIDCLTRRWYNEWFQVSDSANFLGQTERNIGILFQHHPLFNQSTRSFGVQRDGRIAGVEKRPIRFEVDGMKYAVKAGELIDQACEGVAGAVRTSEPLYLDNTAHPVNTRLALAKATRSIFNAFGIKWNDTSGTRNGHFAPFAWTG